MTLAFLVIKKMGYSLSQRQRVSFLFSWKALLAEEGECSLKLETGFVT